MKDSPVLRRCPAAGPAYALEFRTLESYRALISDIGEQFEFISGADYSISLWHDDRQR